MRAALYLRLSKEDKRESIENQKMLLEQYASDHDFKVVAMYQDEAISGLTDARPGFTQMMEDARKGCFDVILAKNQSRFSRNFLHIEQYLHQELPRLHIRFIGVTDGVDTGGKDIGRTGTSAFNVVHRSGKKTRQIYALVNEWYCQEISENVREILHQKVLRGEFIGSSAPFGYQKSAEDSHKLLLKEPEASIVRELYELYANGTSVKEIVRYCQRNTYPSPDKKAGWSVRSVYRILANECYTGKVVQGKTKNASYKNSARIQIPPEEWIKIAHTHEAIISEELFFFVQEKKHRHRRS